MSQLPTEQRILLLLEIVGILALCVRLLWTKLYRAYKYFFAYLVLELLQTAIPLLVPFDSLRYRDLFVASQALIILAYALVVLEIYSKALGNLIGIASIARRYITVALVLALVITALPFPMERSAAAMTDYVFLFERIVMFLLVVFLLLISAFLVYYPVPIGRNVIVYLAGYAVFFLTAAAVTLINNMGYFWNRLLGGVNMGVFVACLIFWALLLSRQGESKRLIIGHQWNPSDEQRLLAQLEAINASLLRSERK